uniref:PDZ domain-containing protein n=1 Tax=Globodera rostochiensis TaxID=31243 RepID=A0A914H531_GLORO
MANPPEGGMKFFCIPASLFCRAGPVEQLDFSQLRLEQVPKEIFKSRKHIEELLLNVNSIEELPADLFRCTKIRRLDVSENKIKVIPVDIGALPSLVELNLSKNEIVEVPEEIGLCHNLAYLDISTNIVTGFPKSFVNLTQLSSLNLSNNSITHLPQDFDRLVNLQFLDVAQCELRLLPPSIVHLEKLRVLDLCDNYLTELPPQMDRLVNMELLDLHCNMIGRLHDELLRCRSLKTLDVSGNQLTDLPLNIGELHNLVELVLCENQIRHLPSSIGQLKKLEVLKASKNNLTVLTPSICSCALLTDLILCENQLQEIPASIGNLRRLRFLDLNVNNLHSFPPTIGGCQSLAILSLRHNHLSELPMEIGKLNQLQVLDLADNSLQYLPYTLTVLYKAKTLAALWLSFNQPSLPKLTTTHEPVMNIKVLTCYLLPQKGAQQDAAARVSASNKSCVGGARVCFAGDARREEDDKIPIGKFERYDTPHPKPFAPKNRLSRNSGDFTGIISLSAALPADASPAGRHGMSNKGGDEKCSQPPRVHSAGCARRLGHGRKSSASLSAEASSPIRADGEENTSNKKDIKRLVRKNVHLRKGASGFEWTIVGGANSLPPYKGKSGLFISQLVPAGAADAAGFRVDDCLLAVNGNDLRGLAHQEAIQLIQNAGDQLDFLIEREQHQLDDNRFLPNNNNNNNVYASESVAVAPPPRPPERCCAMIVRNKCGLPGFTVSGAGRWPEDPFSIGRVDVAVSSLRPADRIISVGGTNVKFGARLDQVKTLLAGFPGTRVEVVVERGGDWPPLAARAVPPKLPPKRYAAAAAPNAYTAGSGISGGIGIGGTSSSAFGEISQTRSLPSLFEPQYNACPSSRQGPSLSPAHRQAPNHPNNDDYFKQLGSPPLVPYTPSLFHAACGGTAPPRRQHRSFSNLLMDDGGRGAVAVKPEMLRASTPIEYPNSLSANDEQQQQLCHVRTTSGMKLDEKMNVTLPMPNSSTSFSARIDDDKGINDKFAAAVSSPPLPPKMPSAFKHEHHQQNGTISNTQQYHSMAVMPPTNFLAARIVEQPPLATSSSPIAGMSKTTEATSMTASASLATAALVTKPSHIPVSSTVATTTTMAATMKMPPPVAPKPKVLSDNERTTSSDYVQQQQQQSAHQQSSPPSPTASSFSSKLKLFEAHSSRTGYSTAGTNVPSKPSGIPLKKPLVCAQDLEKLKEAAEQEASMRRRVADGNQYQHQNGSDGMETTDEDEEHRDTVHELTRLLSSSAVDQHLNGSIAGPSVIRTKKAEMRAERVVQYTNNNNNASLDAVDNGTEHEEAAAADEDAAASLGRADSSLSQRAAEIEKRREWRQARLRSMDVESKRTDELVKMITTAAATAAASNNGIGGIGNNNSATNGRDDDGLNGSATANKNSNNNTPSSPIPIAP